MKYKLLNLPLDLQTQQAPKNLETTDISTLFSNDIDCIRVLINNGRVQLLNDLSHQLPEGVVVTSIKNAVLNYSQFIFFVENLSYIVS